MLDIFSLIFAAVAVVAILCLLFGAEEPVEIVRCIVTTVASIALSAVCIYISIVYSNDYTKIEDDGYNLTKYECTARLYGTLDDNCIPVSIKRYRISKYVMIENPVWVAVEQ